MINTWGKEEITKLNYEFRQDGIYDKKTSKKLKLKFLEYNQGLSMNFGFFQDIILTLILKKR